MNPRFEHYTTVQFWQAYNALPVPIQVLARKQFALMDSDPTHGSLQLKKLFERGGREVWSARVTTNYRAIAFRVPSGFTWFWIGAHAEYDRLIGLG